MAVAIVRVVVRVRYQRTPRPAGVVSVADEVEPGDDAEARAESTTQVGMVVVDARIHHGHLHAGARQSKLILRDVRAGHRQRMEQLRARLLHWCVLRPQHGIHGLHARQPAQRRGRVTRRLDGQTLPDAPVHVALGVIDARAPGSRTKRVHRAVQLDEPEVIGFIFNGTLGGGFADAAGCERNAKHARENAKLHTHDSCLQIIPCKKRPLAAYGCERAL
jgi:hypothetical protein